jgi:hypothetical protein
VLTKTEKFEGNALMRYAIVMMERMTSVRLQKAGNSNAFIGARMAQKKAARGARFKIVKYKVADAIYLLRFETQYEITSSFLRIQEHYESPHFSGRVFTLEEFMDWYAAEYGAFTYLEDWSGFNVPSTARAVL